MATKSYAKEENLNVDFILSFLWQTYTIYTKHNHIHIFCATIRHSKQVVKPAIKFYP